MGILPQFKIGDCSCGCGGKQVQGRKVGKNFYCINSYRDMKTKEQLAKSTQRDKVRRLGHEQVKNGDYDAADRQVLINELDRVFSRIVRLTAADQYSNCRCFTCTTNKHWSMMQCGHFVKRGNTQIRWDFRNAKVQCKSCNENLGGNIEVYTQRLELEQKGLPLQLIEIGREVYHWSTEELKQLLIHLRIKLRTAEEIFKQKTSRNEI